jgi:glycerophosphoryl diester phosphodiesterase
LRTLNAPAWLTERPIAHRGLHDSARGVIENTLAAAEAAIDAGFAIECDVQLSADGELFVFHDDSLDRLTDRQGALIEKSAAEIAQARIKGSNQGPPTFAEFLRLVAGRTPIVCELKSRFNCDWRIGDRIVPLAESYEGPLAFKSFDPDLIAYIRLRWPALGAPGRPCPVGIVAEGSYDDPGWSFLTEEQKRDWVQFEHYDRARPDFLSFNVDHLPHAVPFFVKELHNAPIMAWTVRNAGQREAARKWADQVVFDGQGRPLEGVPRRRSG